MLPTVEICGHADNLCTCAVKPSACISCTTLLLHFLLCCGDSGIVKYMFLGVEGLSTTALCDRQCADNKEVFVVIYVIGE